MFAIESANIVGYQTIKVPTGFSLFTVTFKDVSNASEMNINNIKVLNLDGTDYTTIGKMRMNKMDSAGYYLTTYNYRQTKGGWCQNATFLDNITIKNGEAICLNNTTGDEKLMQVSGEVSLTPASYVLPTGFSLCGNMTPVKINLNDVVPYHQVGDTWEVYPTIGKVRLNKMDTAGYYLTTYNYRQTKGGWCQNATFQNDITLEPGESFCINNTTGEPIKLVFKSPIAE